MRFHGGDAQNILFVRLAGALPSANVACSLSVDSFNELRGDKTQWFHNFRSFANYHRESKSAFSLRQATNKLSTANLDQGIFQIQPGYRPIALASKVSERF